MYKSVSRAFYLSEGWTWCVARAAMISGAAAAGACGPQRSPPRPGLIRGRSTTCSALCLRPSPLPPHRPLRTHGFVCVRRMCETTTIFLPIS
ncbi:hypothetical protein B5X24_HaOG203925 [Helicoverpa armigera]|uniref:Uncharacterized protein n=1 Tax=Helicoverpa armigera TaxID=29058 RepID=A0A2W1BTK6_HELAM|nr:hypothetical protein B5X24_HaOG203925 [Helicoverpa armigera]